MSNYYHLPKLPSAQSPRVVINVDGKDVEVPGDTNLLEALKTVGIETPHFCYHHDLPLSGNCRQCLIETEGPRGMGLAIACYTPVRAGMKVATPASSPKVQKARRAVMEFQLVNHPLDCPICDKAGECVLQENYMEAGQGQSRLNEDVGKHYHGAPEHRFVDTKGQDRGGKAVDLGERVVLDEERCILCDRCVRFMRHVAGEEQLYIAARGDHAFISTFPGQKLNHPYDLNVTDICPVGALTGKHFRFQHRVWNLKRVPSIDPTDALGANIWIDYDGDRVYRIMPRCNPEVNRSWIANSTRMAYTRLSENRLLGGLVNGKTTAAAETLRRILDVFQGSSKIALVASGHHTLEENVMLLELQKALGDRAEIFGGSWLAAGKADGIALSGDPVANRAGLTLLQIPANLDALTERAKEFSTLLVLGQDLWADAPSKAKALEVIPERIVLSAWNTSTVKAATVALGISAWAEVRGTMVNSQNRLQIQQAAPVGPATDLEGARQVLAHLAGSSVSSEVDAWKLLQARVPVLSNLRYSEILPEGNLLKLGGAQ